MADKLIPIRGSVFVNIQPPESVRTITAAESQANAWVKVAKGIGSELPPTAVETAVTESKPASENPIGDTLRSLIKKCDAISGIPKPTGQPKMTDADHNNSRFLNKIKASLEIIGGFATASEVFARYHNKYQHANIFDIEAGLDILIGQGRVVSKVVNQMIKYSAEVA